MNEPDEDVESDKPTDEEIAQMRDATAADAQAVDALILGKCSTSWRKVAMVVGSSLDEYDERFPNLPYVFMPVRMLELEKESKLEVRGDVFAMRASEIRLVSQPTAEALPSSIKASATSAASSSKPNTNSKSGHAK